MIKINSNFFSFKKIFSLPGVPLVWVLGAELSAPKKPPLLFPLPPKIELVAASAVVVVVDGVAEAVVPKADLLPPKTDEPPEVPPPNIEAVPEVDPALPNTDDVDVVVVVPAVVVAVPPNTDGEEVVEPTMK